MRQLLFIASLASILPLLSCEAGSVEINYKLEAPVTMDLFHSGTYSTKEGAVGEQVGTITATYSQVVYRQEGDTRTEERQLVMDKSKGYHKHSMPQELAYRIPLVVLTAQGFAVQSVRGNELFVPKVVGSLPIKEKFKRQLRDARYQLEFDRMEKRRWELGHLVRGEVPLVGDLTPHLKAQGSLPLPGVSIDSVIAKGYQKLGGKKCYEYHVYYQETEPFPYFVWEQYAYSTESGKTYQDWVADSTHYQTAFHAAIDPETGLPCQERFARQGENWIHHPETKEIASFLSFVTVENLYTTPEGQ